MANSSFINYFFALIISPIIYFIRDWKFAGINQVFHIKSIISLILIVFAFILSRVVLTFMVLMETPALTVYLGLRENFVTFGLVIADIIIWTVVNFVKLYNNEPQIWRQIHVNIIEFLMLIPLAGIIAFLITMIN